jgi:hypothetical protein
VTENNAAETTGQADKPPLDKPGEKRLSIFEDFINKLDIDEGPDTEDDSTGDDTEKDK